MRQQRKVLKILLELCLSKGAEVVAPLEPLRVPDSPLEIPPSSLYLRDPLLALGFPRSAGRAVSARLAPRVPTPWAGLRLGLNTDALRSENRLLCPVASGRLAAQEGDSAEGEESEMEEETLEDA